MGSLSNELIHSTDEIVQRWYEAWRRSGHPHVDVSEGLLKGKLALQLRTIGVQIKDLSTAENPKEMWKSVERLDPELRVVQDIPIEQVVRGYSLAVDIIRNWIDERNIDVPFNEYSYFYSALFELTAEAVRRYSIEQANIISSERALHLASLAHQMRNPLSSFSVLLQQLRQSRNEGCDIPETIVEISSRNLQRLISLIDSVLKLERFKPEEISLHSREFYPADLVRDVLADNAHDAAAKTLRLENLVDGSLKMQVDPALFLDGMSNLVQNAIKFTRAGFVRVSAKEEQEDVFFEVADSGPGISEEQQKTLFRTIQPGREGGSGIGLLIVERAVAAQGGTLGLKSEPGKGSVFWFRLPRVVPPRN